MMSLSAFSYASEIAGTYMAVYTTQSHTFSNNTIKVKRNAPVANSWLSLKSSLRYLMKHLNILVLTIKDVSHESVL